MDDTLFSLPNLVLISILLILLVVYITRFLKYLQSAPEGLGEFKQPIQVYAILISSMVVTSFFRVLADVNLLTLLGIIGSISFVTSDSMLSIRDFHHKYRYSVFIIMGTYYLAIMLFALQLIAF